MNEVIDKAREELHKAEWETFYAWAAWFRTPAERCIRRARLKRILKHKRAKEAEARAAYQEAVNRELGLLMPEQAEAVIALKGLS